jgi:hypothetical protein
LPQLVSGAFVTAFPGGLHFAKLSPHGGQLLVKNEILRNSGSRYDDSQNDNHPGSSGRTPGGSIGGTLMLLFGAAFLKVALDSTDAPRNPIWLTLSACGVGLVAVILICQGTVLLLAGRWLF